MDNNETTQTLINTSMLPNFLLWLGLIIIMGYFWYLMEIKPYRGNDKEDGE
jgi:hypothetical protein